MSKQPPSELAAEQSAEIGRWMAAIDAAHTTAIFKADYATIAHFHKKLAGVMREYQRFKAKKEGDV